LKNVYILGELENCEDLIDNPPDNVFYSWLRSKLALHRGKGIQFDELGLPHIDLIMGEPKK
jgi:hypothetical protein